MKKRIHKEKCRKIDELLNESDGFLVKEDAKSLELIDYAISKLDSESQRIIYFDFVYNSSSGWWREYYSKSTYYRLKNKALDHFIQLITEYGLLEKN